MRGLWRFLRRPGYGSAHRAQRRILLETSTSDFERWMVAWLDKAVHGPHDESPDADSDTP